MSIKRTLKADIKTDTRFKQELQKLNKLFKNLDKNKQSLVKKLIENAAFMGILLEDLKADIHSNGYKEEYQNGASQKGFKRSVSADLYQSIIKNYSSIIKQLTDLLPGEAEEDELMRFINNRDF